MAILVAGSAAWFHEGYSKAPGVLDFVASATSGQDAPARLVGELCARFILREQPTSQAGKAVCRLEEKNDLEASADSNPSQPFHELSLPNPLVAILLVIRCGALFGVPQRNLEPLVSAFAARYPGGRKCPVARVRGPVGERQTCSCLVGEPFCFG